MKDKKQTLFIGLIFFILIIPFIIAQEAKINIEHTGYGETSRAASFSIYNTGEVRLTDINVSVDGRVYNTIAGSIGPGMGLRTTVYMEPGEHVIEVETPEGAYDTIDITISSAQEKPETPEDKTTFFSELDTTWIIVGIIIIIVIVVVVIWLLMRKPKLGLEQSELPPS